MSKRKKSNLAKLRVNVTEKWMEDMDTLVAEGYFADRTDLARQALGPFIQTKMEQYLFERLGKQQIIGNEVELEAHLALIRDRLNTTQLSGENELHQDGERVQEG